MIPRRVKRSTLIIAILIAWYVGWQFSTTWSKTKTWAVETVWQPFEWLWIPLIWLAVISSFAVPLATIGVAEWRSRRWMKDFKERQRCRRIWDEILEYGNDCY